MRKEKEIGVVKERPNFGDKQVRQVSELEMERIYRKHNADSTTELLIPIRKSYRDGWIKSKLIFDHDIVTEKDIEIAFVGDMSLSDCGVIPYKNGIWNATNWLEKVREVNLKRCLSKVFTSFYFYPPCSNITLF